MFTHLLDDAERRLRGKAAPRAPAEVEELSAREMSVLRLLGTELSVAEIGEQLYVSRNTVKTHVRGDLPQARRRNARGRRRPGKELGLL